jgi:hypothetical protein
MNEKNKPSVARTLREKNKQSIPNTVDKKKKPSVAETVSEKNKPSVKKKVIIIALVVVIVGVLYLVWDRQPSNPGDDGNPGPEKAPVKHKITIPPKFNPTYTVNESKVFLFLSIHKGLKVWITIPKGTSHEIMEISVRHKVKDILNKESIDVFVIFVYEEGTSPKGEAWMMKATYAPGGKWDNTEYQSELAYKFDFQYKEQAKKSSGIPEGFKPTYKIHQEKRLDLSIYKRKQFKIFVPKKTSKKELEWNVKHLVRSALKSERLDAIDVLVYKSGDQPSGYGWTLHSVYAPGGFWEKVQQRGSLPYKYTFEYNPIYFQ